MALVNEHRAKARCDSIDIFHACERLHHSDGYGMPRVFFCRSDLPNFRFRNSETLLDSFQPLVIYLPTMRENDRRLTFTRNDLESHERFPRASRSNQNALLRRVEACYSRLLVGQYSV